MHRMLANRRRMHFFIDVTIPRVNIDLHIFFSPCMDNRRGMGYKGMYVTESAVPGIVHHVSRAVSAEDEGRHNRG